jgi:exopolysaccharide biosynthesis polyprenyl glycosylphosphotransferase
MAEFGRDPLGWLGGGPVAASGPAIPGQLGADDLRSAAAPVELPPMARSRPPSAPMSRLGGDTIELALTTPVEAPATSPANGEAPALVAPAQRGSTATIRPVRRPVDSPASGWERRYVGSLVAIDAVIALVAGLTAFGIRFGNNESLPLEYVAVSLALPLAWSVMLLFARAYERRFLFVGNEEYRRVLNAGVGLTAVVALISYAGDFQFARGYVVVALPVVTTAGLIGRYLRRKRLFKRRAAGECMRRVVVVGYERPVATLARQLARERYHGMEVIGACLPPDHGCGARIGEVELPVYGTFDTVGEAVRAARADTVAVLPCPEMDAFALRRLSWELEKTGTDLVVTSALLDVAGPRTSIRPVDGLPMLHVEPAELTGGRRLTKEAFDRVTSGLVLILLAPLLAVLAAAVQLTSRGPALFTQVRVGKDGREFTIYKLRTMYADAEDRLAELAAQNEHDGLLFKIRNDPRITPLGRVLRRFSLDELPQLFNVFLGHMSLVGPRPPLPSEVAQYPEDLLRRLAVKPGITGLWQVSGRSNLSWEDTVRLDLRYVENWSLTFDLVILLRTFTAIVRASGAY